MSRVGPSAPVALLALLLLPAAASSLQVAPHTPDVRQSSDDAFLDDRAGELHALARARWQEIDGTLLRYQAIVRQRLGVGFRLPLRDRTLVHHEAAARVIWERGAPAGEQAERGDDWDGGAERSDRRSDGRADRGGVAAVQMFGLRNRLPEDGTNDPNDSNDPGGDGPRSCGGADCVTAGMSGLFLRGFAPGGDPLLLGLDEWDDGDRDRFEHPLAAGAERHYATSCGAGRSASRSASASSASGRAKERSSLQIGSGSSGLRCRTPRSAGIR